MNAELVVIVDQPCHGEYVLASCTHRPSSQQSREYLNLDLIGREYFRRWGLSRNKVAVLEGAAGSPPFFFLYYKKNPLNFSSQPFFYKGENEKTADSS